MYKINWSEPEIRNEEFLEIQKSFDTNWLTMGPKVRDFENKMANFLNVPHAIAVSNGTIALDIALKTLGIEPGDEVIVPSMTYFATASAVSYQYAIPVFVDIEKYTHNIDPKEILKAITKKTKAIIFIDYGGIPAQIEEIQKIAKDHNLHLLQDGAQSLGGIYMGKALGAQTEISTMSFHMAKIMTTVEGGMIFTHNDDFAKEIKIRRNQGESAKYLHSHLGTNARMTDISAAIGIQQFAKLEYLLKERKRVANYFNDLLSDLSQIEVIRNRQSACEESHFFYPILAEKRDNLAQYLKDNGIDTRIAYSMPVYQQEIYQKERCKSRHLPSPNAEFFGRHILNLPIFPSLTNSDVSTISQTIHDFYKLRVTQ